MSKTLGSFLAAAVCAVLAAGCAGGQRNGLPAVAEAGPAARPASTVVGVYVSQLGGPLLEYSYTGKGSPLCSLSAASNASGQIQSDPKNELLVPEYSAGSGSLVLYNEGKTGRLCLPSSPITTFTVPDGYPVDAVSLDGRKYDVAVGDPTHGAYIGVWVCVKGRRFGCHTFLRPPLYSRIYIGISGVAADSTGVYAITLYKVTNSFEAYVIFWNGGKGKGTVVKGIGGIAGSTLSLDGLGNLLAMDASGSNLYVYSGCPSACVPHGPFPLHYPAVIDSLGNGETTFMTLHYDGTGMDVYQYNGTSGITYLYSNSAGFSPSLTPLGIAQRLN